MSNICVISENNEWKQLLLQYQTWREESCFYQQITNECDAETSLILLASDAIRAEEFLQTYDGNAAVLLLCEAKSAARFQLLLERWSQEKALIHAVEVLPQRIEVILSQLEMLSDKSAAVMPTTSTDGKWKLDVRHKLLLKDQQQIALTEKECCLIEALLEHSPKSVEKTVLLDEVWRYHKDIDSHTLETHLYRLRRKIIDGSELIRTTDDGYQLVGF